MPLALLVSVSVRAGVVAANVPLAPDDGAVKVTVTPLNGDPFEVTVAESALNGLPTVALAVYPLFAAMAMTGCGTMFELEPPQLARKPMARQTRAIAKISAEILRQGLRFTATLLLGRPSGWRVDATAASGGRRTGCESYRAVRLL